MRQKEETGETPLVSVIVPVYNAENYITSCLRSLLAQTYEQLEILVINDGSTDRSGEICRELAKEDTRIQLIVQKNQGAAATRNRGLEKASGRYLYFMDADDWMDPNGIRQLVRGIQGGQLSVMSYLHEKQETISDTVLENVSVRDISANAAERLSRRDLFREMLELNPSSPFRVKGYLWNKMFEAEIVSANHLRFCSDYKMWEDMLFCCQYVSHIESGTYLPAGYYHYNQGNPESICHSLTSVHIASWIVAGRRVYRLLDGELADLKPDFCRMFSDICMEYYMQLEWEGKCPDDFRQERLWRFIRRYREGLRRKHQVYFALAEKSERLLRLAIQGEKIWKKWRS